MNIAISTTAAWLIAAAILLIAEIIGGTVALLCLCIGCVIAAILSAIGISTAWQLVIASVVTVATFFMLGPAIKRFYQRHSHKHAHSSNMDALIGRKGRVTATITDNYTDGGRVQIDGDSWQSFTESAERPLPVGSTVIVEAYDSIVLRVRPSKD